MSQDATSPPTIETLANGVECACLFLGPYRNLTTLTAGILALHPGLSGVRNGDLRLQNRWRDCLVLQPQ